MYWVVWIPESWGCPQALFIQEKFMIQERSTIEATGRVYWKRKTSHIYKLIDMQKVINLIVLENRNCYYYNMKIMTLRSNNKSNNKCDRFIIQYKRDQKQFNDICSYDWSINRILFQLYQFLIQIGKHDPNSHH